jgi:hypothetical protein
VSIINEWLDYTTPLSRFVLLGSTELTFNLENYHTTQTHTQPTKQYAFDILFGVDLTPNATEALFHLMDMDGDTELGE